MKNQFSAYNPDQTWIELFNPDEVRKANPILEAIHWFIDEYVKLEDFNAHNEKSGRKATNPKMILKAIAYAYTKGIYSSREIEERMNVDLEFKALCANSQVDHSTICRFIIEHANSIKKLFTKLVYVLYEEGFVDLKFIALDGTKIYAKNSNKFKGRVSDFKKRITKIEEILNKYFEQTTSKDNLGSKTEKKIHSLKKEKDRIQNFLNSIDETPRNMLGKEKYCCISDTDAQIMKISGTYKPAYNCQTIADEKNHIIVHTKVFSEAADYQCAKPMLEGITKNLGLHKDTIFAADAGYYSSENMTYLTNRDLQFYIPEGTSKDKTKKKKSSTFDSRDCVLEEIETGFKLTCPGGQTISNPKLIVKTYKNNKNASFYSFYALKSICSSCEHIKSCYSSGTLKKSAKRFQVKKEYLETLEIRKNLFKRLNSKEGKGAISRRACLIEHVFGEIKEARRFRRTKHQGIEKVNTIWHMLCMAYNIRKLARLKFQT